MLEPLLPDTDPGDLELVLSDDCELPLLDDFELVDDCDWLDDDLLFDLETREVMLPHLRVLLSLILLHAFLRPTNI